MPSSRWALALSAVSRVSGPTATEADLPPMQDEKAGSKEEVVEVVPAEGSGPG